MVTKRSHRFYVGCLFLVTVIFSVPGALVEADTLELKNGKIIDGRYLGGTQNSIRFEVKGAVKTYPIKDTLAITFDRPGPGSTQKKVNPMSTGATHSSPSAQVVVPAGTPLLVRMVESVDSRRHKAGHKFTARLEADLAVNADVVAPRGANVYGQLTQAKQARRLAGKSQLMLTLTGIMINNRIRPIKTGEVKVVAEKGSGAESVGKTARGAAVGALIDGSDGARTGAKVGLGAAILTRGGRLNIAPGTLLDFTLAEAFEP